MYRPFRATAFLLILLGVGLASQAIAIGRDRTTEVPRSAQPPIVVTVTTLEPQGMATIQTVDGAISGVLRVTTWRMGDAVACEQSDSASVSEWQALDGRKAS